MRKANFYPKIILNLHVQYLIFYEYHHIPFLSQVIYQGK